MSLFNKKTEVPEIPSPPELPKVELPEKNTLSKPNDLPSSSGDGRNKINREVIKSAIEDSSEKISGDASGERKESPVGFEKSITERTLPVPPAMPKDKPEPLRLSTVPSPPANVDFTIPREKAPMPLEPGVVKRDAEESIFVRIDKFNSAKRDVQEIERDLREIEGVLDKLTQTKMQEDEEVAEIGAIMTEIKEKMNKVDSEIFNRI